MRDRDGDSELIGCVRVPIERVPFMVDGAQTGADIYYTLAHFAELRANNWSHPLEEASSPSPCMDFSRDWLNDWLEMEP